MAASSSSFFGRLETLCNELDSILCVGLDPHAEDLKENTADEALEFCKRLIDETKHVTVAYKPNAAFFEALGEAGWAALGAVVRYIKDAHRIALVDCKRGDIGSTSRAYAAACFAGGLEADAVTLHSYLGSESITPFCGSDASKGAFVLCKTSNPSSSEVQALRLAAGSAGAAQTVYEAVALASAGWGEGEANVGLVVGATDLTALRRVRALRPGVWILAPGVGAQGADAATVAAAAVRADGLGLLVPVSRGISRASAGPRAAAEELREALNAARAAALAARKDGSSSATAAASSSSSTTTTTGTALEEHQEAFLRCALDEGVLRFGSFTLKSGRSSPYFFNAGLFTSGAAVAQVGRCYAQAVVASKLPFDVVFGPAYKGIPLATAVGMSLSALGVACGIGYNRKEAKDHGEGGVLVGAAVAGKRVLLVDDVMSSGKAVLEAAALLREAGAELAGVVVGLDRQEKRSVEDPRAATEAVSSSLGVPVVSVAKLDHLIAMMEQSDTGADDDQLAAMHRYRQEWGV